MGDLKKRAGILGLIVLALTAGSCAYLRSTNTPMAIVRYRHLGALSARGAIVLLPGFGDRPETFAKQGFVAALRREAPGYDVIAADAHFGYYQKRQLLPRLAQDVIDPLLREGYRELWLVGTSMGGFGAVAYARTHPERVTGLVLLAPYMGPRSVVKEVKRVGLGNYRPRIGKSDDQENFARANFGYLGHCARGASSPGIWLSVGADDGLYPANQLLGDTLAKERFLVLAGGHGWKVWTPAIERLAPHIWGANRP